MKIVSLDPDTAFEQAINSFNDAKRLVVVGSQQNIEQLQEQMEDMSEGEDDIIENAMDIELEDWFEDQKQELINGFEDDDFDLSGIVGEWPGEADLKSDFTLAFDMLSGEVIDDLCGLKIKTDASWKIPAYLCYGGWNACPEPELQCAIWKYWEEKYGAKIVGISGDVIEAYVSRPPETEEDAMALAWEQYLYCADIVDQGCETISNLGAGLINHDKWYFWWD